MKLHTLKPAKGSVRKRKRIGRGQGSGKGGTSTRGHKGAQSRSGYKRKAGFEGGQMPLQRRVPKFGFNNMNRVEYTPINLDKIQELVEDKKITTLTLEDMISLNLIKKKDKVKVLGRGELNAAVEVTAHAFSSSAKDAIEKAGGKAIIG